ncbi:MAG: hypothetical protein AABX13_04270 [Nanoarchaeota archaeon]
MAPAKATTTAKTATTAPKAVKAPAPLGQVTHFYDQIGVAAILLQKGLKVGDKIRIGKNERFVEQDVASMQLEHAAIKAAKKGQEVGLKVLDRVRQGDLVFKA